MRLPRLFGSGVDRAARRGDVQGLVSHLGSRDVATRARALSCLESLRHKLAPTTLLRLVRHADPTVRQAAAGWLGNEGGPQAAEALGRALKDPDEGVCQAAALALFAYGMEAVHRAQFLREPRLTQLLGAVVQNSQASARHDAVRGLAEIGGADANQLLLTAIRDPSSLVRHYAAKALGELGTPDDPSVAAWCAVADRDWDAAVRAGPVAVDALVAELGDEGFARTDERCKAAAALGTIGDPRAVAPLIAAFRRHSFDLDAACRDALVAIGEPAVDHLARALNDPDEQVRQQSALRANMSETVAPV